MNRERRKGVGSTKVGSPATISATSLPAPGPMPKPCPENPVAMKKPGKVSTGEIKRNWGHKRHRLISKSKQGKRLRRGTTTMEPGDAKLVLTYMPYLRS